MLTAELIRGISATTEKVVKDVAAKHGKTISGDARNLLEKVVIESLELREEEWERKGIKVSDQKSVETNTGSILKQISESLWEILDEAANLQLSRNVVQDEIPAICILSAVNIKWCNIFPICRPSPPSDTDERREKE